MRQVEHELKNLQLTICKIHSGAFTYQNFHFEIKYLFIKFVYLMLNAVSYNIIKNRF